MNDDSLISFGKKFTRAWCSQTPANVAAHFAEDGSLKVNDGVPAVGGLPLRNLLKVLWLLSPTWC